MRDGAPPDKTIPIQTGISLIFLLVGGLALGQTDTQTHPLRVFDVVQCPSMTLGAVSAKRGTVLQKGKMSIFGASPAADAPSCSVLYCPSQSAGAPQTVVISPESKVFREKHFVVTEIDAAKNKMTLTSMSDCPSASQIQRCLENHSALKSSCQWIDRIVCTGSRPFDLALLQSIFGPHVQCDSILPSSPVSTIQARIGQHELAPQPAESSAPISNSDIKDMMSALRDAHETGQISDEEYETDSEALRQGLISPGATHVF